MTVEPECFITHETTRNQFGVLLLLLLLRHFARPSIAQREKPAVERFGNFDDVVVVDEIGEMTIKPRCKFWAIKGLVDVYR